MSKHDRALVAKLIGKIRTATTPIIEKIQGTTTEAKKVFTEEFGIASNFNFRCPTKEKLNYGFCEKW